MSRSISRTASSRSIATPAAPRERSQSFVSITDPKVSSAIGKIAANAQYFEDRAPWDARYKKQGVKPPLANAVETTIETGDFHVTTIGDNLPNENEIHEKYGIEEFPVFRQFARADGSLRVRRDR